MRRRFFVERFEGSSATIEGDAAHHLVRVLRAQTGQLYELSDGTSAFLARIESVSRARLDFKLLEPLPAPQSGAELTLLLSIVKFDAFEWALEKATELGVVKIIPISAARSDKPLLVAAAKRSSRWRKILLESSQQSRRLRLPILESLVTPAAAFSAVQADLCVLLSERSSAPPIRQALRSATPGVAKSAVLAFGPEGGWTEEELASARSSGFREASLGPLILRAETAVVAAVAVLNYEFSAR